MSKSGMSSTYSVLYNYNPLTYRGYIYDTETGFYYLQSRYYDPSIGRFLNADNLSYLGADGTLLSYNLYAYCGNNPVMGYDPAGTWNWDKFISGAMMVAAAAVCVACEAAAVASCGVASPLMGVVIGVTVTAAVLYATEGVAEMVEAGTEYNFVRDGVFGGDEEAYETSKVVLYTIMQVGTMIVTAGSCFVAGTPVAAEEGNVPIETIMAGDYVWAYDEETGKTALKQVVETYVNESDELIHLTINGEEIVTTPTHPFYVPQKGWTSAAKLRAGDILVLLNGEYAVLEQIQHELLESPIRVYNFQVEDYHTYYVGDTGVLVHNSCEQKQVGSYLIKNDKNEVVYVGKGTVDRMNVSLFERGGATTVFYPATTQEIALANEAYLMVTYGGAKSMNIDTVLLNMINSPGLRFLLEWF